MRVFASGPNTSKQYFGLPAYTGSLAILRSIDLRSAANAEAAQARIETVAASRSMRPIIPASAKRRLNILQRPQLEPHKRPVADLVPDQMKEESAHGFMRFVSPVAAWFEQHALRISFEERDRRGVRF